MIDLDQDAGGSMGETPSLTEQIKLLTEDRDEWRHLAERDAERLARAEALLARVEAWCSCDCEDDRPSFYTDIRAFLEGK